MSLSPVTRGGGSGASRARDADPRSPRGLRRPRPARDRPALRLAGADAGIDAATLAPPGAASASPSGFGEPIAGATDPRWVLAVRTGEQLEGTLLTPERRHRLVRLGRVMGLTPFDCNLVIAIVQDQARRGHAPAHCPAAGEPQLRMVPPPRPRSVLDGLRHRPIFLVGVIVTSVLMLELMLLRWFI